MALKLSKETQASLQQFVDTLVQMQWLTPDGVVANECWVLPEEVDAMVATGWRVNRHPYPLTISFD